MAKQANVKLQCKECGHENEITIYLSLNAQLDTEACANMLSGKLFTFECAKCGKQGMINHDMLYHDMVHRVLIHYAVSPESLEKAYESIEKMKQDKNASFLTSDYSIRVVKTQNSLREKALIFNHGMDDRVMEVLKALSAMNIKKDHSEIQFKEALFLTNNCKWLLQLLGGEQPVTAEIPMAKYDEIRRKMEDYFEETEIIKYAVDAEWAIRAMKNGSAAFEVPKA